MRITDGQRRARLVARHRLAGTATDVHEAVGSVVAMHASDPLTPFLGVRARLRDPTMAIVDLEDALYEHRTLWRLHAIRRTLFVATLDDAVLLEAAAGREVARRERRRLRAWLVAEVGEEHVDAWVADVEARVLATLADGRPRTTTQLTALVPQLATEVTLGSGRWSQRSPVSSRVLFALAMEARIVRGRPAGTWRSSQFHWALTDAWFDPAPPTIDDEAQARAGLLRRYLAVHGPATSTDVRWWTGWTVTHTRAALADVGAVTVELDGDGEGFVLPDDLETVEPRADHVALLPGLDPAPMGWKERAWFLGPRSERLYDANGNVGPTVWVDGRVVGGWAVRSEGEVAFRLLEDVDATGRDRVAAEAQRLGAWLDGTGVTPRFFTPLERELAS